MKNIKDTVFEVALAVLPVTLFVILLQIVLRLPIAVVVQFLVGAVMVTIGLILFLLGVHLGLLQIGESTELFYPR